jgi:hypothetical protein
MKLKSSLLLAICIITSISIMPVMAKPFMPDNIIIKDNFEPGIGLAVGQVVLIEGDTIITHENELHGFLAKKYIKLYSGDTLLTTEHSRISILLNDCSRITMGAATKLSLNRFIFDPVHHQRTAYIMLLVGKARFHVQKLHNFQQKSFNIKTKTSLIGVYGSDFIIQTTLKRTEVTTLSDTVLSLISLTAAYAPPVLLHDYMWSFVNHGELPSDVEKIGIEMIEMLKLELPIQTEPISFVKHEISKHHQYIKKEPHKHQSPTTMFTHQMDKKIPSFHTKAVSNEKQADTQSADHDAIKKMDNKETGFSLSTENNFSTHEKHTKNQAGDNQNIEYIPYIRLRHDELINPEEISNDLVNPLIQFETINTSLDSDIKDQQSIIEAEQTDKMPLPFFPQKPKY